VDRVRRDARVELDELDLLVGRAYGVAKCVDMTPDELAVGREERRAPHGRKPAARAASRYGAKSGSVSTSSTITRARRAAAVPHEPSPSATGTSSICSGPAGSCPTRTRIRSVFAAGSYSSTEPRSAGCSEITACMIFREVASRSVRADELRAELVELRQVGHLPAEALLALAELRQQLLRALLRAPPRLGGRDDHAAHHHVEARSDDVRRRRAAEQTRSRGANEEVLARHESEHQREQRARARSRRAPSARSRL
jgi:hypothetical protein